MKKILIPNGRFHDVPMILEAKRLGFEVICSGNVASQIGYQYADKYIPGDFSNLEEMLQIARDEKIDAICSNCHDLGYLSSCYVAEKMNLPGHESYDIAASLLQKDRFKTLAKKLNLHTPPAEIFSDSKSALEFCRESKNYPLIIKPPDLGGGLGMTRLDSFDGAQEAIDLAFEKSRKKVILVEKFIEGTAHSFNVFIVNQRVVNWYSDNEYEFFTPRRISTSASPADKIELVQDILIEDSNRVAQDLNLPDGLLHSQYILDESNQPWILEITRRMSGDWYPEPESRATGIDWIKYIVRSQIGEDCSDFPEHVESKKFTGRHCLNPPRIGRVKNFEIDPELEQFIYKKFIWFENEFEVKNPAKDYPGIIFLDFPDRKTQIDITTRIKSFIKFNY